MILRVALRRSSSMQPTVLIFDDLQLPHRKITFCHIMNISKIYFWTLVKSLTEGEFSFLFCLPKHKSSNIKVTKINVFFILATPQDDIRNKLVSSTTFYCIGLYCSGKTLLFSNERWTNVNVAKGFDLMSLHLQINRLWCFVGRGY